MRGSIESAAGRPAAGARTARTERGGAGRPCVNGVTVGVQLDTVCHRRAV